jgi:hypothetical protein
MESNNLLPLNERRLAKSLYSDWYEFKTLLEMTLSNPRSGVSNVGAMFGYIHHDIVVKNKSIRWCSLSNGFSTTAFNEQRHSINLGSSTQPHLHYDCHRGSVHLLSCPLLSLCSPLILTTSGPLWETTKPMGIHLGFSYDYMCNNECSA